MRNGLPFFVKCGGVRSTRKNAMNRKKHISAPLLSGRKPGHIGNKSKFEAYGIEMIEKEVKASGNSGRVYLPPDWIGKHVKIIRID